MRGATDDADTSLETCDTRSGGNTRTTFSDGRYETVVHNLPQSVECKCRRYHELDLYELVRVADPFPKRIGKPAQVDVDVSQLQPRPCRLRAVN